MDNELDLDLNENNDEEIISRNKKKINSLSEKLGISEKEKSDLAKAKEDEALARQNAEKERDFFKGFSQVSSKYQGATEYQDQIWEKVKAGYDIEDAAVSILNKEGKLVTPPPERESAAGGSASTGIIDLSDKPLKNMSRDELRSQLLEMESKGEFRL